jgi:S-adenosylmethionine:tRNA ribosyltransferase-isomerase
VRVSDFHFDLPEELIAQTPPATRGSSRMLFLDKKTGATTDSLFADLPHYLQDGDLLILNNSRVIPARLYATRAGLHTQSNSPEPSGQIEVLLTQQIAPDQWTALVRPSRKVVVGERLLFAAPDNSTPLLQAEVITTGDFGERTLRFQPTSEFFSILNKIGHMPLPPYIHRVDTPEDRDRYQTVFAQQPGSAAAPTAGLHFTEEMLATLKTKGIQIETVTLHVGLGTFQPVRVQNLEEIRLHEERYIIPARTADAIESAYKSKRRIIAAGTTAARTLEGAVLRHCESIGTGSFEGKLSPEAREGTTNIFISPGHKFVLVNGLLTNFHLPQSTLLMLVSAFAGREAVLTAYAHAVRECYRFFSYGDCMLIL